MTTTVPTSARPRRIRRTVLIVIAVLIAIAIVLPFISLGRYHRTIAASLARSLGHPVYLDSVNLTAFPLPGLEIHNLIIEENPPFGAEPLLRAPEVTVFPSLSSLWTGRLEISRIAVDNASVNLVHDSAGNWNFSSLLLKASHSRLAPTAQHHHGAAPRFPYISFSSARINFKQGAEKKPLSFLDADAAIWLAGSNRWRIRFKAQPARTDLDLDLEDAGTVHLDGSLTRAASLDQLPLNLHAEWTGAQLGLASRMVLGHDSLWRGSLTAQADVIGNMNNLVLRARLHIDNLHRLEFTPLNQVSLTTRCRAVYHHAQNSLDQLICLLPTGSGHLLLTGSIPRIGHTQPQLNLEINHTPVAFALQYFGLLRSNLARVLTATGDINGDYAWAPLGAVKTTSVSGSAKPKTVKKTAFRLPTGPNILTGQATVTNLALQLANADKPFIFPALHFNALAPESSHHPHKRHAVKPAETMILLQPAAFDAGANAPMQVAGRLTRSGLRFTFAGSAAIARLLPVASDLDPLHPLASLDPRGTAQLDLAFASPWVLPVNPMSNYTAQGTLTGFARIEHAGIHPAWLPYPVTITTATAQFTPGGDSTTPAQVNWVNAQASVNGIAFKGSASWPLKCASPAGCPAQVSLDFPTLHLATLASTLTGAGRHDGFIQSILSHVESPTPWPPIHADVHASTLTLGRLHLANARASLNIQDHHLQILSLDAATLGGSLHSTGTVTPASGGPQYALNLTWTGIKLPQAAAIFHETWPQWGATAVDGEAALQLHGYTQLAAGATGTFRWLATAGRTKTALWPDEPTAHRKSASWAEAGTIANRTLTLTQGPLKGTISFDRKLNLTTTASPMRTITGTLAHPLQSHDLPPHAISPKP